MPGRGGRGGGGGSGGRGGIVSSFSRTIAGGIGLVSESMSDSKRKKEEKQRMEEQQQYQQQYHESQSQSSSHSYAHNDNYSTSSSAPPPYQRTPSPNAQAQAQQYSPDMDDTDEWWNLDDVQQDLPSSEPKQDLRDLLAHTPHPHGPIPLPVILPQRRPKDRTRGFVHAYAPVLSTADISEPLWFAFLDALEKESRGSAWFHTINVAAMSAMALPMGWSQLVAISIHKMVGSAREIDAQRKGNKFLEQMNRELFMPRGLFCLLMTWKPDVKDTNPTIDLDDTVNGVIAHGNEGMNHRWRSSDGVTRGDFPVPEAAELIFPDLDQALDDEASGKSTTGVKAKLSSKKDFVSDYYDRRARAEYAGKNPNSLLVQGEQPEFSSRWADPNSAANNGYLSGALTGGIIDRTNNPFAKKKEAKQEQGESSGRGGGFLSGRGGRGGGGGGRGGGRGGGHSPSNSHSESGGGGLLSGRKEKKPVQEDWSMSNIMSNPLKSVVQAPRAAANLLTKPRQLRKKAMKPDVLYLMVVNMPAQEEMDDARRYT